MSLVKKEIIMKTFLDEVVKTDEDKLLLEQELAILDITELIHEILNKNKINEEELKSRLSMAKIDFINFMDDNYEPTVRDIVSILWVLGYKLNLAITKKEK